MERSSQPHPISRGLPVSACVTVLVLAILCPHVGRGLAGVIHGNKFAWSIRDHVFTSLPQLITSDLSAGLAAPLVGLTPTRMWLSTAATEAA